MSDIKKQLLQLIEDLKLPIVREEAVRHLEKLNDDEVSILVSRYQGVKDYQDQLEKAVYDIDSQKYVQIEDTYYKKYSELEDQLSKDLEENQKKADKKFNDFEKEIEKKNNNIMEKSLSEFEELEKQHERVQTRLASSLSES